MTTKQSLLYLFLPLISATSSLHAAGHDVLSDECHEQKAETLQHPYQNQQHDKNHFYDYTLRNSKRDIDHTVDPDDLDEEKEYLADNTYSTERKLKNKEKTLFFLTIVRNKEDSALYKYFFSNIDLIMEEAVINRAQRSYGCHIIANDNPEKSPHVLFQLLGWQASGNEQLTPISIHLNRPVCPTCHAILFQLIGVDVATNEKGCCGDDFPAFDKIPAMAQKYINSHLTLS